MRRFVKSLIQAGSRIQAWTGGGRPITPEMTRTGVYTYKHTEKKMLDEDLKKNDIGSADRSGSYEINDIDVKISRIGTTNKR